MESLKKAMADAKRPRPIQDLLKEQMAKLREQVSGGGRGNGNRRGGSGGSGSGGSDDESFKETLDEIVQVILATVAFILVVIIFFLLPSQEDSFNMFVLDIWTAEIICLINRIHWLHALTASCICACHDHKH